VIEVPRDLCSASGVYQDVRDTAPSLRLLGYIRLDRPDRTVELGPAKQLGLLAALVLNLGATVPVDVLVDRVWDERPPRRARNSLATYASRLRRLLDGVIELRYSAGGYLADCPPDLVDLHRARRLVVQARTELAAGQVPGAAGLFRAALCGWQDEPLAGVTGDWAARVRAGLQRERLDVLGECLDADLLLGRDAQVTEELHRLVVDHPTAEALVARLMTVLARAGRSVEALNCYTELRAAVAAELGTEPSAPLRDLHVRLLREDPDLVPAPTARAPLRAVPPLPPPGDAVAGGGGRAVAGGADGAARGTAGRAAAGGNAAGGNARGGAAASTAGHGGPAGDSGAGDLGAGGGPAGGAASTAAHRGPAGDLRAGGRLAGDLGAGGSLAGDLGGSGASADGGPAGDSGTSGGNAGGGAAGSGPAGYQGTSGALGAGGGPAGDLGAGGAAAGGGPAGGLGAGGSAGRRGTGGRAAAGPVGGRWAAGSAAGRIGGGRGAVAGGGAAVVRRVPGGGPTAGEIAAGWAAPDVVEPGHAFYRRRTGVIVPAQLPAYAALFNGRDAELGRLAGLRAEGAAAVVLTGAAGVGKTTLAVHWAHRIRGEFPDGQLYVNLNGYSAAAPTRPLDALAAFLLALGVAPDRVPVDGEQAAALYRSLLADRRMLVLLDNAREPDQLRPLLPGAPGCLTVITSRDRLSGLAARDGAARLTLDVLDQDAAAALLARALGPVRVAAEPAAAAELAAVCGGLPLALRISAAHLLDRPECPIADYLTELRAGGVGAMWIEGDPQAAVGPAFELSYVTLPDEARRLFRLLALAPGLDISLPAAAALAGMPVPATARLLDRLAAVHLVGMPGPGRWAMHDLVREYAAGLTARDDRSAAAAVARLLGWYRHAADAATERVHAEVVRLPVPPARPEVDFDGAEPALAWLGAERDNLLAAVRHAAAHGPREMAWLLTDTLRPYCWLTQPTADWLALAEAGTTAATAAGDTLGRAAMALTAGTINSRGRRYAAAAGQYETATRLAAAAGWLEGEASAGGNAGEAYFELGEPDRARAYRDRSADLYLRTGTATGLAMALVNQGHVDARTGQLGPAAARLGEAWSILAAVGALSAAHTAIGLADTERMRGNLDRAIELTEQALAECDRPGLATLRQMALVAAADALRDAGRLAAALTAGSAALEAGATMGAAGLSALAHRAVGDIHLRRGALAPADRHYREALRLADGDGAAAVANAAHIGLARLPGPRADAVAHLDLALAAAERGGYRLQEADARTALAEVELAAGNVAAADSAGRRALAIFQQAGARPAVAGTLVVLGRIAQRSGDQALARRRWRRAVATLTACGCDARPARDLLGAYPASATG
jgi:DNA-binding SARP family transcriptional activator/tetratricopeptide (TPR) repeat protein